MFDARAAIVTALTSGGFDNVDTYHDFKTTALAERQIKEGKFPVSNGILGVGDWRVIERSMWSHGRNIVKSEFDILLFFRGVGFFTDYDLDGTMAAAITKHELGSANTLICELKKADEIVQVHDNIYKRRWILEVTSLEDTN